MKEIDMEVVRQMEKRLAEINTRMVDILQNVCSFLRPSGGNMQTANKLLEPMRGLRQESLDLLKKRETILKGLGCDGDIPPAWELWETIESIMAGGKPEEPDRKV